MKGLFLGVLIFGGDYTGRKICVSKSVRLILGEISAPSREPYETVSAVLIFQLRYFEYGPLEPGYVSVYISTTIQFPLEDIRRYIRVLYLGI